MQVMYAAFDGVVQQLTLPSPDSFVLPGVEWGAFDELLTPAFWCGQVWQHRQLGTYASLRLGETLVEEVAACLLGGYGMPAELALAAYRRLRDAGMLNRTPGAEEIEAALSQPFENHGQLRKYRFPRQKAVYLSASLQLLREFSEPEDDRQFRDCLAQLPGIGLKTASWVVRNLRPLSSVAVIDVHILRVGRHIGIFPRSWEPARNYRNLEERFVEFADALNVPAPALDSIMWHYMRRLSSSLFRSNSPALKEQPTMFA
jgi:thermostable 8-oxoguanine DNA glycosylase